MKVLHINCNYIGTNAVHRDMMEHLSCHDIDNHVFVPTSTNVTSDDPKIMISKCFNKYDRIFYFHKQRKIIKSVIKKCDVSSFNIIHAYTLFSDGNVAYNLYKKYNIPYVVAVRDTDLNTFLKYKKYLKPLARKILKNASQIFFLSESYKIALSSVLYGKKDYPFEKKTKIVPNGLNRFWLENIYSNKKMSSKSKKINIIYAGKINKRKNILATQNALELLRDEGFKVHFTIAGSIEDENEYQEIMKYMDTEYVGPKNKEELRDLYRKNDIFVMPSHTETFGLVYAEAMTQGLPVVYTKNQGFDNQFNDGEVGYSVLDNDFNSIADAIKKIVNNYAYISSNALKKCIKFDWEEIVKVYIKLYKQIDKEK